MKKYLRGVYNKVITIYCKLHFYAYNNNRKSIR